MNKKTGRCHMYGPGTCGPEEHEPRKVDKTPLHGNGGCRVKAEGIKQVELYLCIASIIYPSKYKQRGYRGSFPGLSIMRGDAESFHLAEEETKFFLAKERFKVLPDRQPPCHHVLQFTSEEVKIGSKPSDRGPNYSLVVVGNDTFHKTGHHQLHVDHHPTPF